MADEREFIEKFMRLANLVVAADALPRAFGTRQRLSRSEIHTIEAIGDHPGLSVTELASLRGISKSAASQLLARLKAKRLVSQSLAGGSSRDTSLSLTASGRRAYEAHEAGHRELYALLARRLGELSPDFLETLSSLLDEVEASIGAPRED
jgi:Transcriptional regulators